MTAKQKQHHKIANEIRNAALQAHTKHRAAHAEELLEAQSQANAIRTELGLPPIYLDPHGEPLDPLIPALRALATGGQR